MRNIAPFVLLISFVLPCSSQNINPNKDKIYRYNEVANISIKMDATEAQDLLDNIDVESNTYYKANLHFKNSKIDTTLVDIGIRLRGNTSRNHDKKSIKIDFKEFGGEKFKNYKKFNLKPDVNDPSMVREYLALHLYRNFNVPAARASYCELHINDEYIGIYLNVEQIDDEFIDRRFGNEYGNLFKCVWGANLSDLDVVNNNDIYILKTNEEIDDRSTIISLIEILQNSDKQNFTTELESVFNVEYYLKQLAVESTIGHWDGYSFNQNNFYLYEDSASQKIIFIPYDLDNTFGVDYFGEDWGIKDVTSWYSTQWNIPLTTAILSVDNYFENYCRNIITLYDNFFNENYLFPVLDSVMKLIKTSVEKDELYTHANYSYEDFLNSYDQAWGNQVKYGVKEYITTRINATLDKVAGYESFGILDTLDKPKELYFPGKEIEVGFPVQEFTENQIRVFPNPVKNGYFFIQLQKPTSDPTFKLIDMTGKIFPVQYLQIGANEFRIYANKELQEGVYTLIFNSQNIKIVIL